MLLAQDGLTAKTPRTPEKTAALLQRFGEFPASADLRLGELGVLAVKSLLQKNKKIDQRKGILRVLRASAVNLPSSSGGA
jgi:hypothetical protein